MKYLGFNYSQVKAAIDRVGPFTDPLPSLWPTERLIDPLITTNAAVDPAKNPAAKDTDHESLRRARHWREAAD